MSTLALPPARSCGYLLRRRAQRGAISLACIAFLAWAVPPALRWAVLDATWMGTAADLPGEGGACWAFVLEKFGMSIFGLYPFDERWRPAIVLTLFGALVAASLPPPLGRAPASAWAIGVVAMVVLMLGGAGASPSSRRAFGAGSRSRSSSRCSGSPPAIRWAIALALGRQSSMRHCAGSRSSPSSSSAAFR